LWIGMLILTQCLVVDPQWAQTGPRSAEGKIASVGWGTNGQDGGQAGRREPSTEPALSKVEWARARPATSERPRRHKHPRGGILCVQKRPARPYPPYGGRGDDPSDAPASTFSSLSGPPECAIRVCQPPPSGSGTLWGLRRHEAAPRTQSLAIAVNIG
jgi:hypothetical protein